MPKNRQMAIQETQKIIYLFGSGVGNWIDMKKCMRGRLFNLYTFKLNFCIM